MTIDRESGRLSLGITMNLNQIFGMFARMVTRRAMNWGMNKGIDYA